MSGGDSEMTRTAAEGWGQPSLPTGMGADRTDRSHGTHGTDEFEGGVMGGFLFLGFWGFSGLVG